MAVMVVLVVVLIRLPQEQVLLVKVITAQQLLAAHQVLVAAVLEVLVLCRTIMDQ